MKLDYDLAREILLTIENYDKPNSWVPININNYSNDQISYHIKKLYEAGLIEAISVTDAGGYEWKAKELTWEGHQFLDAARDNIVWQKAKKTIKEKTISLSFEVLKATLVQVAKQIIFPNP